MQNRQHDNNSNMPIEQDHKEIKAAKNNLHDNISNTPVAQDHKEIKPATNHLHDLLKKLTPEKQMGIFFLTKSPTIKQNVVAYWSKNEAKQQADAEERKRQCPRTPKKRNPTKSCFNFNHG